MDSFGQNNFGFVQGDFFNWTSSDFKKMLKSQTGPPLESKMLKYLESPLSQLPYLELFQSRGGASQGIFGGGQSRDIFRGSPVKKHPVLSNQYPSFYCMHTCTLDCPLWSEPEKKGGSVGTKFLIESYFS